MSTNAARVEYKYPGCLQYGDTCKNIHYAEVIDYNTSCTTKIRLFTSKTKLPEFGVLTHEQEQLLEDVEMICCEWSGRDALLEAFAQFN